MRLLLIGAFPYPHDQGSQVYFQEQAIALRGRGAEVELLTYGPSADSAIAGASDAHGSAPDPDRWRALDGFVHHSLPAWVRPATGRSGPSRAKLLADVALAWRLSRSARSLPYTRSAEPTRFAKAGGSEPGSAAEAGIESRRMFELAPQGASKNASRRQSEVASSAASNPASFADPRSGSPGSTARYDAVLAHHVEAAAIAIASLPPPRPPIVFCLHTLLEQELPLYLNSPRLNEFLSRSSNSGDSDRGAVDAPPRSSSAARTLAAIGRRLEQAVALRAEGWIALTQSAERVMRGSSDPRDPRLPGDSQAATGARIAPPLADPRRAPFWRGEDLADIARAHGLEPNGFFLYAGNLDPYQDLPLLAELARVRAERRGLPLVLATHDPRARALAPTAGIRVVELAREAPLQALVAAARATLVPRRALGGFPIKLANSLAHGTPVVAFHAEEWGLADGRDALIADPARPVASFAAALDRLECDGGLAERLRFGARATWARQHAPESVAAETLDLVERVRQTTRARWTSEGPSGPAHAT